MSPEAGVPEAHLGKACCSLAQSLSRFQLFATPWTGARQAPLSMEFSRQESWSGLPFPPPGDLPNPGIKPTSPALAGGFFVSDPPGKPPWLTVVTPLKFFSL